MSFDYSTLVTDRTGADYERFKTLRDKGWDNMTTAEQLEWAAGMKGSYNYTDLNRVGAALNDLRDRLTEAGYLTTFTAKTSWAAGDIPTGADLTEYLFCVSTIREALALFSSTPAAPKNVGALSIQEANDIEQIALDIHQLIQNMIAAYYYCGDLYGGEV